MKLQKRFIRVFISSTFRDMMPEREYLMKIVFPELRRKCAAKFLEITEVDLRWGVTDEEAKEGKVIEICLNEIDKSRPYFIGLLGNRYGWIPVMEDLEKYQKNIESFPWVKDDVMEGLSITEMEIQYGVLRNPAMIGKAFFYLKDYQDDIAEDESLVQKLNSLKGKIISQDVFYVRKYQSVEEMGQQILSDLWEQIELDYPDDEIPDEHEREKLVYGQTLLHHTNFYFDSNQAIESLNQLLIKSRKLLVYGLSGQGKSALLANYIKEKPVSQDFIYYACGATAQSTSPENLARYIAEELKRMYDISLPVPKEVESPVDLITAFLGKIPGDKSFCLFIDGIEKLTGGKGGQRLNWVPDALPRHLTMVLSSSSELHLELLEKKNYAVYQLQNLTSEVIEKITVSYFDLYSKKLSPEQLNRIVKFPLAGKPVVLFTLLNELRVFGVHEQLADFISYYTRAKETEDFFTSFIRRLEKDFEDKKYNLSGILTAILLSNNGLTEIEITRISQVSMLNWSQIYNAIDYHIVNKNGLLSFGNNYIEGAIKKQYLTSDEQTVSFLEPLVGYFSRWFVLLKDTNDTDQLRRVLEELPELAIKAQKSEILKDVLSHLPSLVMLFEYRNDALARLITALKQDADLEELLSSSLQHYLSQPVSHLEKMKAAFIAGYLISIHQSPYKAAPVLNLVLEEFKQSNEKNAYLFFALKELVQIYHQTGYSDAAAFILERLLPYQHDEDIADTFDLLGTGYLYTGNFRYAEMLQQDTLDFYTHRYGDKHVRTAIQLNNLARVYDVHKNFKEAETLYSRAADIIYTLSGPDSPLYQSTLSNIGILYLNMQKPEEAKKVFLDVLKIRTGEYGENHRLTLKTMNSLGVCESLLGNTEEAMILLKKTAKLQVELLGGHHNDTLVTLGNIADVYTRTGDYDEAEKMLMHVLNTTIEFYGEMHEKTINAALALAGIYEQQGKKAEAISMYEKTYGLKCKFYGENHPLTRYSLDKLNKLKSDVPGASGDEDPEAIIGRKLKEAAQCSIDHQVTEAGKLYQEVVEIVNRQLGGNHPAIFESLNQLAVLSHGEMEFEKAAGYTGQMVDMVTSFLEPGHEAILEFQTLKAYNLYKAGDFNGMVQVLYEVESYRETLLKFPKKHIAGMYHEMLGFFTGMINCQQKYENEKARFDQLSGLLDTLVQEVFHFYNEGEVEKALISINEAIRTANILNDDFGIAFEKSYEYKAVILENLEKMDEALQAIHDGLTHVQKWLSPLDPKNLALLKRAGDLISSSDKKETAGSYYKIAQKINRREEDYPNQQTVNLNVSLILLYVDLERFDILLPLVEETLPFSEKILGSDHDTTKWLKTTAEQLKND